MGLLEEKKAGYQQKCTKLLAFDKVLMKEITSRETNENVN